MLPGDEGEEGDEDDEPPPQAVKSVASVATDATWQAPPQNWRRDTAVFGSDIAGRDRKIEAARKWAGFQVIGNLACRANDELAR